VEIRKFEVFCVLLVVLISGVWFYHACTVVKFVEATEKGSHILGV
jgi:hypothetical protein